MRTRQAVAQGAAWAKGRSGGVGGRGATLSPVVTGPDAKTCNQNATAAETRCVPTDSGGLSAPAAGLEPATRRLTAACSTN